MFAEYTTATAPVSNVRAVGSTRGWVIQMCSSVEIKAVWEKVAQDSGRPLMILEKLLAPDIRATGQGETCCCAATVCFKDSNFSASIFVTISGQIVQIGMKIMK